MTPAQRKAVGGVLLGGTALAVIVSITRSVAKRRAASRAPRLTGQDARHQQLFNVSYEAAAARGVRPDWMVALALKESRGNFRARNTQDPGSGAWGAWQFLEPTARANGWTGSMQNFLEDPRGQARTEARFLSRNVARARTSCSGGASFQNIAALHNSSRCYGAVAMTEVVYVPRARLNLEQVGGILDRASSAAV